MPLFIEHNLGQNIMPESQNEFSQQTDSPVNDWMIDKNGEFIDLHATLHSYADVIKLLKHIEIEYSIKEYSNGNNAGARWLFQIYSREFIQELASIIEKMLLKIDSSSLILEVMAGDGRLAEFLRPLIAREYIATDAKSKRYNIAYPKWVHKIDAVDAIEKFSPSIVVMSWEPYLSTKSLEIVDDGIPLIWIGNPDRCGHIDLFDRKYVKLNSTYCVSRHDKIGEERFTTDMFTFNCDIDDSDPNF
jgi:hypothetical protein